MPKVKSHKGLLKRIKITGTGKVRHKRAGTSHLNSGVDGQKHRELRAPKICSKSAVKHMERLLHCRLKGRED